MSSPRSTEVTCTARNFRLEFLDRFLSPPMPSRAFACMLPAVAAAVLAATAIPAHASGPEGLREGFRRAVAEGRPSYILDIDNDSLLLQRDDGFYSSGLRLTGQYALSVGDRTDTFGWRLGQELYTASDIKLLSEQVGPPDHPYAGWLYGGIFRETRLSDGSYQEAGIDIGCLGPCAGGERTQNMLHHWLNQPLPKGWGKQVRQEYGVVLHGSAGTSAARLGSAGDLAAHIHGRFGNIFTDAGAAVLLRIGQLHLGRQQPALLGFLRVDGRIVGHNATLEGGYFSDDNPHTVKPKRLVGEAEAGIIWNITPYAIRASVVRRSNEIRGLPDSVGSQNFARLQFSWSPQVGKY